MGQRNIAPPAPAHPVKHGMTPMTFVLVLSAIATSSPLLGQCRDRKPILSAEVAARVKF